MIHAEREYGAHEQSSLGSAGDGAASAQLGGTLSVGTKGIRPKVTDGETTTNELLNTCAFDTAPTLFSETM